MRYWLWASQVALLASICLGAYVNWQTEKQAMESYQVTIEHLRMQLEANQRKAIADQLEANRIESDLAKLKDECPLLKVKYER